jgi:hypothetical protein
MNPETNVVTLNRAGAPMIPSDYDTFIHQTFTSAMEGGVNYWASVSKYRWALRHDSGAVVTDSYGDPCEDYEGFTATLLDNEDEDAEPRVVNREVIERGIRALADGTAKTSVNLRKKMLVVVNAPEMAAMLDLDASDADCIVQAGLFGEVVYG